MRTTVRIVRPRNLQSKNPELEILPGRSNWPGARIRHTAVWVLYFTIIVSCCFGVLAQEKYEGSLSRLENLSRSLETIAVEVGPSVVQIFVTRFVQPEAGLLPSSRELIKESGSGSGMVLSADGHIITNAHVVERARRIQVMQATAVEGRGPRQSILAPAGKPIDAKLVGIDEETDLAVIRVDQSRLAHLQLGDSDSLRPGQLVLAFGSPLGLENSVTMGIVSATARQFELDSPMIYIQTDASINPGNSGGPLVNTAGDVVGINTLILSRSGGSEGIGFAVPSNIVRHVFDQIREFGRVRRGELGLNVQTITPTLSEALNLGQDWGVVVSDVVPGTLTSLTSIQPQDIILRLDGKIMENARQFDVNVYRKSIGSAVELELQRGDSTVSIQTVVREREEESSRFFHLANPQDNLIPQLGILAVELSNEIRQALPPLRQTGGVLVAARSLDGSRGNGGFLPGDVIHSINNQPVADLASLRQILADLSTTSLAAHIQRGSGQLYVSLTMD